MEIVCYLYISASLRARKKRYSSPPRNTTRLKRKKINAPEDKSPSTSEPPLVAEKDLDENLAPKPTLETSPSNRPCMTKAFEEAFNEECQSMMNETSAPKTHNNNVFTEIETGEQIFI